MEYGRWIGRRRGRLSGRGFPSRGLGFRGGPGGGRRTGLCRDNRRREEENGENSFHWILIFVYSCVRKQNSSLRLLLRRTHLSRQRWPLICLDFSAGSFHFA